MNDVTFSIVIPSYNRELFIKKTLESVLRQTFADFEIIVVDDGSTDNTAEVVRTMAESDERIIFHPKKNEERAVARNTGTALARGKYITFLDSDDLLYENHFEAAHEIIEKYDNPEFFRLRYEFKDGDGKLLRQAGLLPEIGNDHLIEGNHLACCGVFLRRDVAQKHLFNTDRDLTGTEDYELWLRIASYYPLYCDNRITAVMVQHDNRSVMNTDRWRLVRRIELLEKYLFENEAFIERFQSAIPVLQANNRIYIALHLALSGNNRLEAINYLRKALSFSFKALENRAFYGTIKRLFIPL